MGGDLGRDEEREAMTRIRWMRKTFSIKKKEYRVLTSIVITVIKKVKTNPKGSGLTEKRT